MKIKQLSASGRRSIFFCSFRAPFTTTAAQGIRGRRRGPNRYSISSLTVHLTQTGTAEKNKANGGIRRIPALSLRKTKRGSDANLRPAWRGYAVRRGGEEPRLRKKKGWRMIKEQGEKSGRSATPLGTLSRRGLRSAVAASHDPMDCTEMGKVVTWRACVNG